MSEQIAHNSAAKISIIIPVLNEADNIKNTLLSVYTRENTESESIEDKNLEIIVVDGGSEDDTLAIVKTFKHTESDILGNTSDIKIIFSPPGRALQMNAGAKVATGNILLFLHADTCLPDDFHGIIANTFKCKRYIAGAFTLRIDAAKLSLRLVEWGVKLRSRFFGLPYGDQGIFVRKNTFEQIGGFPEIPIMEDFEFIGKLKKLGKIAIIPSPVVTSPRRWLTKGVMQTTIINQFVIIAFSLGISPYKIRDWYRQGKLKFF